jgi:hypothetical protein
VDKEFVSEKRPNQEPPFLKRGEEKSMDTTVIRVVAGVMFLLVLGLLIQRRRTRVK